MSDKGKVSAAQFFCVLFVCRIITLFTFIITDAAAYPAGDRGIVFAPFILAGTVCAVPVMLVIGRGEDRTLFTLTDRLSPTVTRCAALLYTAGAVWSAAMSTVRFELFMSNVMYTDAFLTPLIALMLGAAVLIAARGLEPIARMSVGVLSLIAVSLLYVGATTAGDFEAANLEPPLSGGAGTLLKEGFFAVARTSELAVLLILAPRIRGSVKKGYLTWLTLFGLTISALFTLILGVTGAYGERQMFQLYALTVLSRIGVIERLDSLICAIWVLCSLTRLAFHLYAGALYLEKCAPVKPGAKAYLLLSLPVFGLYALFSGKITRFAAVLVSGVNEAVFSVLLIGIPLAVWAADKIKQRNGRSAA